MQNNCPAVVGSQPSPTGQPPSTELLAQVVQYIMENLQVDLSVSALAGRFSLKESALLPAFESHTGVALDQFVLRRRIEHILHLLKHSNASDSEIAMGVGWGTAMAFRTAFFQYLGLSPTDYRDILPSKQHAAKRKRPCKSGFLPWRESRVQKPSALAVQ